jgi:tRNA (guanine-N7-)-methyltransferase
VRREGKIPARSQRAWDELGELHVIQDLGAAVEFVKRLKSDFTAASEKNDGQRSQEVKQKQAKEVYEKIVLEIGTGQGNQIIHAATEHPENYYIGVEVYKTGVAHTLLLAKKAGASNFTLMLLDAAELLDTLAGADDTTGLFDEVWTFFPDPWPKLRHKKRRLIDGEFLKSVKRVLKRGGCWRIATDWDDYADQIRAVDDKMACTPRFDGRVLTNFEKKGIEAGREIYDFCYTSDARVLGL